jgi:hypothetical protein
MHYQQVSCAYRDPCIAELTVVTIIYCMKTPSAPGWASSASMGDSRMASRILVMAPPLESWWSRKSWTASSADAGDTVPISNDSSVIVSSVEGIRDDRWKFLIVA